MPDLQSGFISKYIFLSPVIRCHQREGFVVPLRGALGVTRLNSRFTKCAPTLIIKGLMRLKEFGLLLKVMLQQLVEEFEI